MAARKTKPIFDINDKTVPKTLTITLRVVSWLYWLPFVLLVVAAVLFGGAAGTDMASGIAILLLIGGGSLYYGVGGLIYIGLIGLALKFQRDAGKRPRRAHIVLLMLVALLTFLAFANLAPYVFIFF